MQEFKGSIATVEVQLNKQTADFNDVKAVVDAQMTTNSTEISLLMATVNEISNQQPIQWKDIVQQQVTESSGQVNDNIQIVQTTLEETRAQAAEQCDKESRRNYHYIQCPRE